MVVVAAADHGDRNGEVEALRGEAAEYHQSRRPTVNTPNKDDRLHNDNVAVLHSTVFGRNSAPLLFLVPVATKEDTLEPPALRLVLLACTHSNLGILFSSLGNQ